MAVADYQVISGGTTKIGDGAGATAEWTGEAVIFSFRADAGVRLEGEKAILMFERMDVDASGGKVLINGRAFGLGRTPSVGANRYYADMITFDQSLLKANIGGANATNTFTFKSGTFASGALAGTLDDFWVKNVVLWYKVDVGENTFF